MDEPSWTAPLVSVIVPVHNGERYLAQCLDSVLAQSLGPIEVIAVDDGSTDASPEILSGYAAGDDRIRIITQPNQGVSAARNAGLTAAAGQFVSFVDADDYLAPSMLEDLHLVSQEFGVDIVACGIEIVDPEGRLLGTRDFPLEPRVRYDSAVMREALHSAFATKMLWYPFRSLYSRHLLISRGLRFDEGIRKGEDSLFNLQALFFSRGSACVREAFYFYRQHSGSATARPLASESSNIERLGQEVLTFYQVHDFDSRAHADFYGHVLRSDLPTALSRLRGHADQASQVRALLSARPVADALRSESILRLQVPLSVKALLALCKLAPPAVVAGVLQLAR